MSIYPFVVAGWLLVAGMAGLVRSRNLVHAVISLSVCQSSTYLLLLAVGYRRGGTAPVFGDTPTSTTVVDPVVQAMTLTDIVVGATVTALLLALAIQIAKREHTVNPDRLSALSG